MKYLYKLFIPFLFLGCNYLDIVPKGDILSEDIIFERYTETYKWFQTCYVPLGPSLASVIENPAYTGADEVAAGDFTFQKYPLWKGFPIANGLQTAQTPYGNLWQANNWYYGAIRYCNTFLKRVWDVYNMEETEKKLWSAEIKAVKAHYYFELMRRYGPIILVPENIGASAPLKDMQQPRSPVDVCVDEIVRLLDEAMKDLPPLHQKEQNRRTYHSLESAAALKAQVLLLAASPIFNGNTFYENFVNKTGEKLVNTVYDREKWKRAAVAADEAIDICLKNGKRLISEGAGKSSKLLNTLRDLEYSVLANNFTNDEAIFMLNYGSPALDAWPAWTRPNIDIKDELWGSISPSMKMVEMYYTEHGIPIDEDKEWDYSSRYLMSKEANTKYEGVISLNTGVLALHLRREPRFYAHIAADRCYFQGVFIGKFVTKNDIVKAYRGESFGSKINSINSSYAQNLTGYWMKKGSYLNVRNRDYKKSILQSNKEAAVIIRLAELYLIKAEAWNEYLEAPDREHVYAPLNEIRRRAGIPDVEVAWMDYSKTPDKVLTREGMREIIRREWDIEFAFEGKRFWNLRRWLTAGEVMNEKLYGWNIIGETAQQFYNNYEGPVVVWSKHKFISPRDYLFPIRSEEVLISGCVQNPGW